MSPEKRILLAVFLISAFFLGLLVARTMIHGMREGQYRIRGHLWNERDDGWMFWAAGSFYAAAGILVMGGSIALGVQWFGR